MDKDKKLYEKFDKPVMQVVIYAKAASVNAKVDCIYPESFMIGILTVGENRVTTTLMNLRVNLDKCLKSLKKELASKITDNEIGTPNFEDLKISKQVVEACKLADKFRTEVVTSERICIHHVFLALLQSSTFMSNLLN